MFFYSFYRKFGSASKGQDLYGWDFKTYYQGVFYKQRTFMR